MGNAQVKSPTIYQSKHINYQLGMYYLRHGDYTKSERFLRYAANAGNLKARNELNKGINKSIYLNHGQRINLTAIELLEQLITQSPSETQIHHLEEAIKGVINDLNIHSIQ